MVRDNVQKDEGITGSKWNSNLNHIQCLWFSNYSC